jgi:bis(5'-nucleosyl)-tetraphosphatase (symmetrical)
MTTYAISDVQGCYSALRALLAQIRFNPLGDRLWFVGDLVNRGPQSLEVLRYVRSLGDKATVVLGNHDLHLLAVAEGFARARAEDTLAEVLAASDVDGLLTWLRTRPLLAVEAPYILVHAGLLPQWDADTAVALAAEASTALRGPGWRAFLQSMYGGKPDQWSDSLAGSDRFRVIINAMTRLRFCTASGVMDFAAKGEATEAPPGFLPWFDAPGRRSATHTIIFGHWSALGLHCAENLLGIDTGCVWGGRLTAVRLEDRALYHVPCAAARPRTKRAR